MFVLHVDENPPAHSAGVPIYILLFSHKTQRAYFYRKDQAENETGSLLPNRLCPGADPYYSRTEIIRIIREVLLFEKIAVTTYSYSITSKTSRIKSYLFFKKSGILSVASFTSIF